MVKNVNQIKAARIQKKNETLIYLLLLYLELPRTEPLEEDGHCLEKPPQSYFSFWFCFVLFSHTCFKEEQVGMERNVGDTHSPIRI